MTHPTEVTRNEVLQRFAQLATRLLDEQPKLRSVLLSVSQYWNDQADDEVHGWVTASERDQPVWPHECGIADDAELDDTAGYPLARSLTPGEHCPSCIHDYDDYHLAFYGGYSDAMVEAFEAFCPEGAHQEMSDGQGYAPFAIARRAGAGIQIERLGRPQRPCAVIGAAGKPESKPESKIDTPWSDPRALALLREVAADLDSDAPRAVLSDYLLESHPGEPLGEALALCLAPQLDDEARERRDQLIAAHRDRWIHPLGEVIALGCAELDRGILRAADVYADEGASYEIIGAPAWATVETIRIAPGSVDVIDDEMRALRDIGPLGERGVQTIARTRRPWAIERLHVRYERGGRDELYDLLIGATSLPRLRELIISLHWPVTATSPSVDRLVAAPWWPALERLTLLASSLEDGAVIRTLEPLRRLGKPLAIAEVAAHGHPAGWQIAFVDRTAPPFGGAAGRGQAPAVETRAEVSQVGWHAGATIGQLRALIRALPEAMPVELVASRYRSWLPADLALLQHSDRTIRIA